MLRSFDFWLLDKVFQPLVDRRAEVSNGQRMAVICMQGVIVFMLLRAHVTNMYHADTVSLSIFVAGLGIALANMMYMLHYCKIISAGTANPLRQQCRIVRMLALGLLVPAAFYMMSYTKELSYICIATEMLLWTCAFYLVSTNKKPPYSYWSTAKLVRMKDRES